MGWGSHPLPTANRNRLLPISADIVWAKSETSDFAGSTSPFQGEVFRASRQAYALFPSSKREAIGARLREHVRAGWASHHFPQGCGRSYRKYFNTLKSGLGAAWPSPQIEASRIACDSSVSSASSQGPPRISLTAFSVPTRHGVHWPQLSSSKKGIRLSATALASSWSQSTTIAWEPTKRP